jgi:hypothetical protein
MKKNVKSFKRFVNEQMGYDTDRTNPNTMNTIKKMMIDEIKKNGPTRVVVVYGYEFFDSVPVEVPHDSSLADVRVEIEFDGEVVKYEVEEVEGEEFRLEDLTLGQLVLLIEKR